MTTRWRLEISPGQVVRLDPGEDVTVGQPADSGATSKPFSNTDAAYRSPGAGPILILTLTKMTMVKGNFSELATCSLSNFPGVAFRPGSTRMVFQLWPSVYGGVCMDAARTVGPQLVSAGLMKAQRSRFACGQLACRPKWDGFDPFEGRQCRNAQIEAGLISARKPFAERAMSMNRSDREIAAERQPASDFCSPRLPPPRIARQGVQALPGPG